jgi:uncharacterized delta-60 repeat protein
MSIAVPKPAKIREPLGPEVELTLDTPPGALAIQPDGKILVGSTLGGFFTDPQSGTIGYYTRGALRFETNGALDRTFLCAIDRSGSSSAMAAQVEALPDGRIFLNGLFNFVDGEPRGGQAWLLSDGSLDSAYEPWRGMTNSKSGSKAYLAGGVVSSTVLPDGSVAVVSGALDGPRAPYPWTVYRLDSLGRRINPVWEGISDSEFTRPSGLIMTLGPAGFWARKPIDWGRTTPASRRPPFNPTGPTGDSPNHGPVSDLPFERWLEPPSAVDAAVVLETLFEEVPVELCRYAVRLPDRSTILAIRDRFIDGSLAAPGRLMKFNRGWQPVAGYEVPYEMDVRSWLTLRRQPDGRILVFGLVGSLHGEVFPGLMRLEPDGSLDASFHCATSTNLDGRIMDLTLQTDGRIVIGGFFTRVNGVEVPHLARLNADGSLDSTFRPPMVPLSKFRRHRVPVQSLAATRTSEPGAMPGPVSDGAPPPPVMINSLTLNDAGAVVQFSGAGRRTYVLQARDGLTRTNWVSVSTNTADAAGSGALVDREAKNYPMRFYRIATY